MSDDGPGTTSRGARRPSTRPARPRLLTWVAAVVVLVVVGASFAVVQVRAARAADVRAATQQAAEASATQAARVAADAVAARTEAARLAQQASLAAARAAAVTTVQAQVAAAEPVLAASAGKVDDDAVRQALATAIQAAHGASTAAAEPASPTAPDAAAILAAGTAVDTARAAVEAAQATWQQAADATVAAAAAAAKKPPTASKQPAGSTAATSTAAADLAAAAAAAKAKAAAGGVPVWVTSVPTADGDGSNGHMPMSSMCLIGWGTDQIGSPQYLRCDAADALNRLNDAFRARFGESLAMDLTYRSYDEQVRIAAYYGALAATPGTSSHGLGTALDVQEWPSVYEFGTERYAWLVANAPTYGWFAPARVRETGAYPEYWHYEYGPGRTS